MRRSRVTLDEEEPCAEKETSRISLGFREKKTEKNLLLFDQGCLLRKVSSNYVVLQKFRTSIGLSMYIFNLKSGVGQMNEYVCT
jgi:hypothetical protein